MTTEVLNKAIKDGYFTFQFHTNNPFITTLNIIKETEKAIQVEHDEYKNKIWLPKSALICDKIGVFTLKKWLKNKLLKTQDVYQLNALGV